MSTLVSWRKIIAALVILVILAGGSIIAINKLLHLDSYKEEILAELRTFLHREVQYDRGEFSFRIGPSFVFTNIIVKERGGDNYLFKADRLRVDLKLLPLLHKKVVIDELSLERPVIFLSRDTSGRFNISDLLEESGTSSTMEISDIRIKKGEATFVDNCITAGSTITTPLKDMDLSLNHLKRGKTSHFKLSAAVQNGGRPGTISIAGTAKLPPARKPLLETRLNAELQTKNLNIDHFWPYYSRYVPFRKIMGRLDFEGSFKGKPAEFASKGKVRIAGLNFNYPQVFHAQLAPDRLSFSYDFELSQNDVTVKSIDLNVDGLNVKGSCAIKDFKSKDPRIVAKAVTSQFNLQQFGRYIPYGIIVKDTADFIEQHIKGGIYRLDDGRLDGKVSQILHMELGENYNVLAIKGRVEKGLVTYGSAIPTFNNIKGSLEMRGKDFLLTGMTGNFGTSPFMLDGKITDYPLDKPSSYPFTMQVNPRHGDLLWLLGKEYGARFTLNGDSNLRLTGSGGTSSYQLSGDWNLTQASYSYPDFIGKPAGRANSLSFSNTFTRKDFRLNTLQFNLAPLVLNMSASYGYDGKKPLSMEIRTNQVQLNEIAGMLPVVKKYQASGRIQLAVQGEGVPGKPDGLSWKGKTTLKDFSCKPNEQIKTVSNINGTVNFNGTNIETSQLAARIGNSTIIAKGKIAGFTNPALALIFSAARIDPVDFGFRPPQKELQIANVQGSIVLKDNNLQLKSLSGYLNRSFLQIKGRVQNLRSPKTELTVTSSYLDIQDILLANSLERAAPPRDANLYRPTLTATIYADTGKGLGVEFEKLRGTVLYEGNILYLQPLEFSAMGGKTTARIRIDGGSNGTPPRYQVSCNINKVSAERFMQALNIKSREITGSLSMQAELTARGDSADEIKKSALGSVQLTILDGSLRRFSVLSKIFSILNVSQLLKFQLPDMVSGGMPFNDIKGNFSVRDGIVSSSNLFVSSEAMNISAVGKVDIVKNELDVTIGVQPLQTVDKVINRIPIVGWILTGKDRSFITTYFEATGKLDDPSVSAIPVKSMARGVLDIFKRVFELPARLITDTGEVIIGK